MMIMTDSSLSLVCYGLFFYLSIFLFQLCARFNTGRGLWDCSKLELEGMNLGKREALRRDTQSFGRDACSD